MKVRELMNYLNENYKPDDAIVVAWWDQSHFDAAENLTQDEWAKAAEHINDIDWWYTHDALGEVLDNYLENQHAISIP